MNSSERKALATLGRRGGKKAAERWKNDPDSDYAKQERTRLAAANRKRKVSGNNTRARVLSVVTEAFGQTGKRPTRPEIMAETGLSRATVTRHVAALREAGFLPET